jgi:hypothetical protein
MNSRIKPVVVGLSGGLGNQMFQYAAGRSLALRLGAPLILDISWFGGSADRHFALSPFRVDGIQRSQWPLMPNFFSSFISRLSRRWLPHILGVPVWREPHFHYSTIFSQLTKPVFLEGYWQSEHYFQDIRHLLLQEFALRDSLPYSNAKLIKEISECDSICVHVRRGDYLTSPVAAKVHGTCGVDYYQAGVRELCRGLVNPKCFIFSDDPDWVHKSLFFDCPVTVVDLNGPREAHLDLVLMTACKHFLIANSSLSWWGAWLGQYDHKKVIAPKNWFLNSDKDTRDLLPSSWLRR